MNPRTKQILLVIALFAGAGIIAFGLYFIFFRGISERPTVDELTDVTQTTSQLPIAAEGQPTVVTPIDDTETDIGLQFGAPAIPGTEIAQGVVTQTTNLTNEDVTNIARTSNGSEIAYYSEGDGQFYKINERGEIVALSSERFNNVEDVAWADDANKAILTYPDGTKQYYNFQTQQKATLPSNWEEFSFSPDTNQIAFKETSDNPEFEWLSIANPDGTGKQAIEHLGINSNRVDVTWSPNNEIVGHYWEGSAEDRTILYFVGKNNENLKATFVEGYNVQSQWTPDGEQLLYSAVSSQDNYNPRLWIVNARGNTIGTNRIDLGISTFAEKCSFAQEKVLYCAVPDSMERGAGLEPGINNGIPDSIYRIDLRTGEKTKVAETDIQATIDQLIISEDESNAFFVDNNTQNLHRLRLR